MRHTAAGTAQDSHLIPLHITPDVSISADKGTTFISNNQENIIKSSQKLLFVTQRQLALDDTRLMMRHMMRHTMKLNGLAPQRWSQPVFI